MNLSKRITQLEEQAEQFKTGWVKCQGAIEALKAVADEEKANGVKKPVAKIKKK